MTQPPDDALVRRLAALAQEQDLEHALLLTDPDGTIVGALGATERVLGVVPVALQGLPLLEIFTPADRERGQLAAEMQAATALGRSEDDRWHLRGDGSAVWVSGTMTALRDGAGRLLGFAKLIRDRTDLRTHGETLENRIEGLRDQLQAGERVLQTVGHEVRNCLAPLASAIALVQQQDGTQAHAHAVRIAKRQIAVLERLAADLMDAARTTGGRLRLQPSTFDLRELADAVVDGLADVARARRITLLALLPPLAVRVHADRERLQQVLANLVDNALKHTAAGGRVSVRIAEEPPHAVLRVEDDGDGIPPDLLPHVFQLFARGEDSRGLGIGLALARQVVEQHDGVIEARSGGAGGGAEFTVRLPLPRSV